MNEMLEIPADRPRLRVDLMCLMMALTLMAVLASVAQHPAAGLPPSAAVGPTTY